MSNKIQYFPVDTAINDIREIRGLILPNGIKMILISDPTIKISACAVGVGAGFFQDEFEGSAHFLEHLLFMGSKKYPEHSEYHSFIQTSGGLDNAYTSDSITNYYLTLPTNSLEKGIEMLSWFFREPLLQEKYIKSEMEIINSEHQKNILSDLWKVDDIFKKFMEDGQKFTKFGTGSLESLKDITKDDIFKLYNTYYTTDNMYVCIIDSKNIKEMIKTYVKYFEEIPVRKSDNPERFKKEEVKFRDNNLIIYNSVSDYKFFSIYYLFKAEEKNQVDYQLTNFLSFLLGSEFLTSIAYYLKEERVIEDINTFVDFYEKEGKIILNFYLIKGGLKNIQKIYFYFIRYIERLKNLSYEKLGELYENYRRIKLLKAMYKENINTADLAQNIVENLVKGKDEYAVLRKYITPEYSKNIYERFMEILSNPLIKFTTNINFLKINKNNFTLSKYYDTEYHLTSYDFDNDIKNMNKEIDFNFDNLVLIKDVPIQTDIFEKKIDSKKIPSLIIDNKKLRREVYYLDENKYRNPISSITVIRKNVNLIKKENSVILNIYFLICEKILNYYNNIMKNYKMYFEIKNVNEYIILSFMGIDNILQKFISEIIKKININYFFNDENKRYFNEVIEELIIDFENVKYNFPYLLTRQYLNDILENNFTYVEIIKYLEKLTWDTFKKECVNLLKYNREYFLFVGNFSNDDDKLDIINSYVGMLELNTGYYLDKTLDNVIIKDNFKLKDYILNKDEISKYEINNCLLKNYIPFSKTIKLVEDRCNLDELIELIYKHFIYQIMAQLLNEPLFTKIRTDDKLGYVVKCNFLISTYNTNIKYILEYLVQSNYPIERIEKSINEFNEGFKKYIVDKKKELENKFNNLKVSKISILDKDFSTLDEEVNNYISTIVYYHSNIFNRNKLFCKILSNINFDSVYKSFQNIFYNNNKIPQFNVILDSSILKNK